MKSSITSIPIKTITGSESSLANYAGKVLLVVNVASKCGLTSQYQGLEELYETYRARGFEVLGFPSNDFMGQEPGSDSEILEFCQVNYAVDFPMFSKVSVSGDGKHPLYGALIAALPHATAPSGSNIREMLVSRGIETNPEPEVLWNFEKFLIGRDGGAAARFSPDTRPDDPILIAAIEKALA